MVSKLVRGVEASAGTTTRVSAARQPLGTERTAPKHTRAAGSLPQAPFSSAGRGDRLESVEMERGFPGKRLGFLQAAWSEQVWASPLQTITDRAPLSRPSHLPGPVRCPSPTPGQPPHSSRCPLGRCHGPKHPSPDSHDGLVSPALYIRLRSTPPPTLLSLEKYVFQKTAVNPATTHH